MSKSEILDELASLGRADRREILERIWEMEEAALLGGAQPDSDETLLLDRELEEFKPDPKSGSEWKQVEPRLREQIRL
jgi:hypothetical protein